MSLVADKLAVLPNEPGVYRFLDSNAKVIYVGKAKNLKKRVSSYFTSRAEENRKLQVMTKKIVDIEYTITANETDAFLLENTLIKKFQPRYNVNLKDDKSYPWICIKKERFPRIFITRRVIRDGSVYYGPYTSVYTVRMMLDLIVRLYTIRTCNLQLSPQAIKSGKYKVCLEYHIGNCLGPCEGLQSEEEYNESINNAADIIKGNAGKVIKILKDKMNRAAEDLNFEAAAVIKDHLERLENYQSKSVVVNPIINNVDVFSLVIDDNTAYSNFLRVVNGSIINSQTLELRLGIEESKEDLLSIVMLEITERYGGLSHEIIVPFLPEIQNDNKNYIIPQRGDKLKLLEMSERNAKAYKIERLKHIEKTDPERHVNRILETMAKDLHLQRLPKRIECFDNSNIQGTNPVAACVVFIDTKPAKKEYRKFNIKTVEGPDDYASMEEVIFRRYRRIIDENQDLPDLIVVDGGKGQLGSAIKSLERLGLFGKIPILALAEKLEEIYFPGDSTPLHLGKNTETLKVLMHIRDEAHRFGLKFHQDKRSINFIKSQLEDIPGIGKKTAIKLLSKFKSINGLKKAGFEELAGFAGKRVAELLTTYFKENSL